MKNSCVLLLRLLFTSTSLIGLSGLPSAAQTLLTPFQQIALAAVSTTGQLPGHVTMTGNANWIAGSLEESGSVVLTAGLDGSIGETWTLPTQSHSSVSSSIASGRTCMNTNAAGKQQQDFSTECLRPFAWFAPWAGLGLMASGGPLVITDMTQILGQSGVVTLSYSRTDFYKADQDSQQRSLVAAAQSSLSVTYDAVTGTVSSLSYQMPRNFSSGTGTGYRIAFSNYSLDQGLVLPHHIQRYVQGTLQADITITNISITQ